MNATINLEKKHFPVLLDELISIISPLYGGSFIDCTFGQGGYTKKILENADNKVFAIDRDLKSLKIAEDLKDKFNNRFKFEINTFSKINKIKIEEKNIKAIIFDLGFSLTQINDPTKGLSFNHKGKLNMKMGLNDYSAHETINFLSEDDLYKIFKIFGEEQMSKKIAKKIIYERKKKIIYNEDLVKIIDIVKKNKKGKIHNSTKIFQSLRIFVNKEISELIYGLINSFKILPIGGVIAVITFHSIEDKIVKFFFRNYSENKSTSRYLPELKKKNKLFKLISKKPILPSNNEILKNPPSRSAKLRYGIKINNAINFDEFLIKFKSFLEVENIHKKL
tara:strand:+ start:1513 stop:2517 length:1005 start_codon:yes stop_codon:yes gene_type:complete